MQSISIVRLNMWTYFIILFTVSFCALSHGNRIRREEPDLNPGNWDSCKPNAQAPPTRVPTKDRVDALRTRFATEGIQAYLIPNEDAHQSEYPSAYDKRRGWISGFQGSAGFAVVTDTKQALWTDGRYFLEAEDTLDCHWILMREREIGVPSMIEWLKSVLTNGQTLGASPFLSSSSSWKANEEALQAAGIDMKAVSNELIDALWNNDRPAQPNSPINALPIQFAGVSWENKVTNMREQMAALGTDMMVVTGLDETAWLFNLRASDIDYNPFFLSYAIVANDSVSLYLLNHTQKLTNAPTDDATSQTLAEHLNTGADGTCLGRTGMCVDVREYEPITVTRDVDNRAQRATGVLIGYACNQAIYAAIPNKGKIVQMNTPIATTKTMKNSVEVEGMKKSHIRDAVALISFLERLEREVKEGKEWTELSAAKALAESRYAQQHNRGLSFPSISSSGSNGAIIHYTVTNLTDKPISTSEIYLLDSGGQYLDGTTDVTRTFHFGTPNDFEKECYTRVMMGHINLFLAKFRKGVYGREIDAYARGPLWDVGLVYRHGTGHGIGMYLSVHEGPGRISLSHALIASDHPLDVNQFFSDEPGYYEDGKFGIRLENIVMVTNASTKYHFPGTEFLTFEHVTLVPYAPNLINYDLLDDKQIQYLNDYNELVRSKVGPELQRQGKTAAYEWMRSKTERYEKINPQTPNTEKVRSSTVTVSPVGLFVLILLSIFPVILHH
ncbi:xaa-Pro aminopeptidase 1-like isoform X1 [Mya arenaria]|uniref:xaa-Pro aminopeptidase 1-like isoform X1 n=1 Tax=Mya arenaria TaxID=6604 RepID=UPI0022E64244|nr:xaa-Pro aminopeptidase 1-like isoform X1 [Mya arenaria]